MRKPIVMLCTALMALTWTATASAQQGDGGGVTKYVRYSHEGTTSYGILDGETIRVLDGDLFSSPRPSGRTLRLSDIELLAPVDPPKVIAVGLNYQSHLGNREPAAYRGCSPNIPPRSWDTKPTSSSPPTPRTYTTRASW